MLADSSLPFTGNESLAVHLRLHWWLRLWKFPQWSMHVKTARFPGKFHYRNWWHDPNQCYMQQKVTVYFFVHLCFFSYTSHSPAQCPEHHPYKHTWELSGELTTPSKQDPLLPTTTPTQHTPTHNACTYTYIHAITLTQTLTCTLTFFLYHSSFYLCCQLSLFLSLLILSTSTAITSSHSQFLSLSISQHFIFRQNPNPEPAVCFCNTITKN